MYEMVHDWFASRNLRVRDYDDFYSATAVTAGSSTTLAVSGTSRYNLGYIVSISNFVETAGQSFIFWDLLINDSPAQPFPFQNFQVSLASPSLPVPLMIPIPVLNQSSRVSLRANNATGLSTYICTGRIQIYYTEPRIEPTLSVRPPAKKEKTEADTFTDVSG